MSNFPAQPSSQRYFNFPCRLNIFLFKVRISLQDLLKGGTVGDLANDHRDGNAHSPDAGAASHDLRVKSNFESLCVHLFNRRRKALQDLFHSPSPACPVRKHGKE